MYKFRLNLKRSSIFIIVSIQLLLFSTYLLLQVKHDPNYHPKVIFLTNNYNNTSNRATTYHTHNTKLALRQFSTKSMYTDFNTSLCYKNGTDLKTMNRTKNSNWKCECLPQWHGSDCAQPELIWRALLTARKKTVVVIPRKLQRRLIYIFEADEFRLTLSDVRVNELGETVDLFVIYEIKSDFFEKKLNSGFMKEHHSKILYLSVNQLSDVYTRVKSVLVNLKEDDLVLYSNSYDLPNCLALNFFKIYNNFPEPITFRLRWSVFGYFWTHPNRTILAGYLTNLRHFNVYFNDNLLLLSNATRSNFLIGDLNHYGGWFCEYCNDPSEIISYFNKRQSTTNEISFSSLNKNVIDSTFIEELIENGLYMDSKTELIRSRKYQENYFAPNYVIERSWKFDFLLINMYSKLDYYE